MLKIALFSDFHYKKRMYPVKVSDLEKIFERAAANNVDFVLHAGDFCNDYAGSPEITDLYLNNPQGLAVYGVYGNHDLETVGNSMDNVTPCLCNREVNFAFEGAGHWYKDIKGYRLIGVDTNYSYNEEEDRWEHNLPATTGPRKGNKFGSTMGPDQLKWFEELIADAHEKGMKVITSSHMALAAEWWRNGNTDDVRAILAKYPNTVILCVSGHWHADHFSIENNTAFIDINATINAFWTRSDDFHYADDHTFEFHDYDKDGKEIGVSQMKFNDLSQGKNNWSVQDPLSAILTIEDDGTITVEGTESDWACGMIPPLQFPHVCVMPAIRSRTAKIEL
ncbi:MAG: metallophosphoesterase [Clostridia bacterium]|nr:metallophosphoesterase [Clostridia bacterium]